MPYSSVVRCLMYVVVLIGPDIFYIVSVVSRHMSNLWREYWKAVIWIPRYQTSTVDHGLLHGKTERMKYKLLAL